MTSKLADPQWRRNHLYKIVDKSGRLITFKENKFQAQVNNDPSRHKAILKARQIGFSTGCIIDLLDRTMFGRNVTSVILSHEKDSITKLFRIVLRAYKYMDDRIKPRIDRGGGSKHELYFPEINSRIYCDLESRGDTIHNLHISEYGLMKDDERVRATVDAVPLKTGRITYESTPYGINHFYDLWFNQGRSEKKFFYPWYCFEEYQLPTNELEYTDEEIEVIDKAAKNYKILITKEQIAFRRWKIAQKGGGVKGTRDFIQEYPEDEQSCFLTSGDAIFNLFNIRKMLDNSPTPTKDSGTWRIYEQPNKNHRYVIGADTAEGVSKDSSVGVCINATTKKVAAIIKSSTWKPSEFAAELNKLGEMFRGNLFGYPLMAVERNNHGHAVLLSLEETERYANLYRRKKMNGDEDDRTGWVTDKISRPIMINAFIDAVENHYLDIKDKWILTECLTLVNNEGKIEAAVGKHDDCIIATSIGLQLMLEQGNLSVYEDLTKKIKL